MRKAVFFLGNLNDSDIDWMIASGLRREVPASQILVREGKAMDSLFLVLDGKLSVLLTRQSNREVARLQCGEIIGEMSFVDRRPPSATVQAVERSVVLQIPRRMLEEKLARDPSFAARFYRAIAVFLSDRMRHTVGLFGYSRGEQLDDDALYDDEIDSDTLENVCLGGARFQWLQHRLRAI